MERSVKGYILHKHSTHFPIYFTYLNFNTTMPLPLVSTLNFCVYKSRKVDTYRLLRISNLAVDASCNIKVKTTFILIPKTLTFSCNACHRSVLSCPKIARGSCSSSKTTSSRRSELLRCCEPRGPMAFKFTRPQCPLNKPMFELNFPVYLLLFWR